jgi:hypothetical protein
MMFDASQLRRRKPVWMALSELWLDAELTDRDLGRIAATMAESNFSLAILREIYLIEVAPVVSRNLLCVAGVWTGFDERWLCSAITHNLRNRLRYIRFLAWFPPTRRMMTYATEERWKNLLELVANHRAISAWSGNAPHPPP